jgi:hypothetical protein
MLLSVGALTPTVLAEGEEVADDPAPTTTVEVVAVGLPPVPPTTTVVAVGQPPVPPTTTPVVAVGKPPVPPTTRADAEPVESKVAVQPATAANRRAPEVESPEARVSQAAQSVAARLGLLLDLLP